MTTTALRRTVVSAVLIVALVAALVSYLHIQHLAMRSGQSMLASLLLPFSIDGTVAAASMVMFGAARRGEKPPRLARAMLGLSIGATLAANVAEGMSHGIVGAAVSGWPAVAFAGAVEMFMWDVRRGAATPVRAPVARRARPSAPVSPFRHVAPDPAPEPEPAAGTCRRRTGSAEHLSRPGRKIPASRRMAGSTGTAGARRRVYGIVATRRRAPGTGPCAGQRQGSLKRLAAGCRVQQPARAEMPRHRRKETITMSHKIRAAAFVPAIPAGICGWAYLGELGAATGFAVAVALGLLLWPLLILAAVFFLPSCAGAVVPRRWRIWWRHEHQRPSIPAWLRRAVLEADRHRCVFCGHRADLQLDHVRPWASGGLTSLWNLVTLCGPDNRTKSSYWRDLDGYVHYRSFTGSDDVRKAAEILAAERRARLNPLRWLRAAWSLG